MHNLRIPGIKDIPTAIRLYYERHELTSKDIIELFGCCAVTAKRLKDIARIEMEKRNAPSWNALSVNTDCAYAAWGLDVADLEKRYAKLKKYGMIANES